MNSIMQGDLAYYGKCMVYGNWFYTGQHKPNTETISISSVFTMYVHASFKLVNAYYMFHTILPVS